MQQERAMTNIGESCVLLMISSCDLCAHFFGFDLGVLHAIVGWCEQKEGMRFCRYALRCVSGVF